MTPDEVVKVLNNFLSDSNFPGKSPRAKQALSSAICLIQDYQKLRERVSVEKIFNIILDQEPRGLLGNSTGGGSMIDAYPGEYKLAQSIVTYLQQPTEPIAR